MIYRCVSCGFEDTQPLRDGVNNHWRKGYVPGLRPTSREAICYAELKPVSAAPTQEKQPTPEARITSYLMNGGLWNPEYAIHDAVRDLLIDCKTELSALRAEAEANKRDAERYRGYANILREFIEGVEWEGELPDGVWAICQHWNNNAAIDAAMMHGGKEIVNPNKIIKGLNDRIAALEAELAAAQNVAEAWNKQLAAAKAELADKGCTPNCERGGYLRGELAKAKEELATLRRLAKAAMSPFKEREDIEALAAHLEQST